MMHQNLCSEGVACFRQVMRLLFFTALLFLSACRNDSIGTSCERTGDGFQTRHSCINTCLAWPVTCGDGTSVDTPNICSGMQDCSLDKPCADGQICAVSGGNNYCVPLAVCPSGIPTDQPSSAEILDKYKARKSTLVPKQ